MTAGAILTAQHTAQAANTAPPVAAILVDVCMMFDLLLLGWSYRNPSSNLKNKEKYLR
jgi:hypothetical protein